MLGARVRTYRELQDRIETLPPPQPGLVRVYRGQDQNYPSLLPSGRRRKIARADIWSHYVRRIITSLEGSSRAGDVVYESELGMLWLEALAQHYGAGSNYLDVTHDLGIATWFAFHRSEMATIEIPVGPEGAPEHDLVMRTTWCRLSPHVGPAYVYAFDLKPWTAENIPESGELVDLAQAPPTFHSPRIETQAGCLVYGDQDENLARRLVAGTPIVMESGFETSPYAAWSVEQLFPPPASDAWYARFLSLPFLLGPDEKRRDVALTQSLPVSLFLSSPTGPYEADVRGRFQHVTPLLVHPNLNLDVEEDAEEIQEELEQATVLVLESPQLSAHPPVDDPSWNHELLMTDWSIEVETFDSGSETPTGRVRLDNVFIEFSPLESVGWDEDDIQARELRALWLRQGRDGAMAAYYVFQDSAGSFLGRAFLVRFNPRRGRLECQIDDEDSEWQDITALGSSAKPILSSLVLLRDLSPVPKVAPYTKLDITIPSYLNTPSETTRYVAVSSSAARLVRATTHDAAQPWYVARHASAEPGKPEEPYTVAGDNAGYVEVTGSKPFGRVAADDVRQAVLALTGADQPLLDSALSHVSLGPERLDGWLDRTPEASGPGFIADVTRFAIEEQRRGSLNSAMNAHILAGHLCDRAGDMPGKLSHQLESAKIILSFGTLDAYAAAFGAALETAQEAVHHHDHRRALWGFGLAATSAGLASLAVDDPDEEGPWLRRAIAALLEVEPLEVTAEKTPQWYQFVSAVAEVYDSAVLYEWESEALAVTAELRGLAALAERIIPADFTLEDPQKTLDTTLHLADLSERYGDPAAAAARRRTIVPPTGSGV
jgi:hypothetical protein